MSTPKPATSRSSSRWKRSTTNLANLRLAPLSARFTDDTPSSGSLDGQEHAFTKLTASHRSAPTSPRILSRSSSRRYLGGLSRRSSLYEDDDTDTRKHGYGYGGGVKDETRVAAPRLEIATGQVPKAKSEAALGVPTHQQRLSGSGVQVKRKHNAYYSPGNRASGTTTPRVRIEDDWLTRTGLAANSILQEQKGQSFITSRNSQTTLGLDTQDLTDDDDDEGYEEMAAMSARTTRSGFADDELSPISTRASRWGSRYGSRRTSRRGSMVGFTSGSRTPLASTQPQHSDGRNNYFDPTTLALPLEADFVDDDDSSVDENSFSTSTFTSLGGLVDRLIGFNLFNVDEGRETSTESEAEEPSETVDEARKRIGAEQKRRRVEKARLQDAQQRRFGGGGEGDGAGWEDARWLFGRAREAWS